MDKIRPLEATINVKDYEAHVIEFNGFQIWDDAFVEAFNALNDGDTFLIPDGTYYIRVRSVLENKNDITIECQGTIMPVDGETALIGTITLNDLSNVTINNLTMNGNRDNLPVTTTTGYQSLIEINGCQNVTFNNLYIYNTMESGLNSNGNIENITFNRPRFENIGEHAIYFGATDVNNVFINNLYCENIGMSPINDSRHVAVVKLRNKVDGDIKHRNIFINDFTFISTTNKTGDRQLIQAFDTETAYVTTGTIVGEDTSIFGGNTAIEEMIINNVRFDGRRVCYNFNAKTGYNTPTDIIEHGAKEIIIVNSNIKGATDYLTDVMVYSHCKINFKNKQFKDSMATGVGRTCRFEYCELNVGEGRISIDKETDCNVEFSNVDFIGYQENRAQPLVVNTGLQEDNSIIFSEVNVKTPLSLLITTEKDVDMAIWNSHINAGIKSANAKYKNLSIENTKMKECRLSLYAQFENLEVEGLYDMDGVRKDESTHSTTIRAGQESTTYSLVYKRIDVVKPSDLTITNDKNAEFESSVSENIVTLTLTEVQDVDVNFTIKYKYTQE